MAAQPLFPSAVSEKGRYAIPKSDVFLRVVIAEPAPARKHFTAESPARRSRNQTQGTKPFATKRHERAQNLVQSFCAFCAFLRLNCLGKNPRGVRGFYTKPVQRPQRTRQPIFAFSALFAVKFHSIRLRLRDEQSFGRDLEPWCARIQTEFP
jgi:hypothetical protein